MLALRRFAGLIDTALLLGLVLSASMLHASMMVPTSGALAPVAQQTQVADGPWLPPAPWQNVQVADGPWLPPAPWQNLQVADGPWLPPAPWQNLQVADGPWLPPAPW